MRKILVSGLVAVTAVLGGAGAALAEAGTTGATGKRDESTAAPVAGYWNGSAWRYGPMFAAA